MVPQERHFVKDNESLIQMFAEGLGYGVLTQKVVKSHLETERIIVLNGGKVYENRLALAWYPRPEMPRYFAELIKWVC